MTDPKRPLIEPYVDAPFDGDVDPAAVQPSMASLKRVSAVRGSAKVAACQEALPGAVVLNLCPLSPEDVVGVPFADGPFVKLAPGSVDLLLERHPGAPVVLDEADRAHQSVKELLPELLKSLSGRKVVVCAVSEDGVPAEVAAACVKEPK